MAAVDGQQRIAQLKGFLVTGIGEVLMDCFEDGNATVGGAPFNVAFHAHQLLHQMGLGQAAMVSAVGPDAYGRVIQDRVARTGMVADFLTVDSHPTGRAVVYDKDGETGYTIIPGVAWDYIPSNVSLDHLAQRSDAVVFGSLAQRVETSRASVRRFVSHVPKVRLYDLNLRRNTNDGIAGYNPEIIHASFELANVIKLNELELDEIAPLFGHEPVNNDEPKAWVLLEALAKQHDIDVIALTRGKHGAMVAGRGERHRLPDSHLKQNEIHAVGAGDSFAAGLLCGLLQGWEIKHTLELAEILSQWVVTCVSATPELVPEIADKVRALCAVAKHDAEEANIPTAPVLGSK